MSSVLLALAGSVACDGAGTCELVLPDDGCCPAGATQLSDPDCPAVCGNGALDRNESCDTAIPAGGPGACPETDADCDDGIGCTVDRTTGIGCSISCEHIAIAEVVDGDGCCPEGATIDDDVDCSAACDDGVVGAGETCDTAIASGPGACPTEEDCLDDDPCTTSEALISGGTCQAACSSTAITMPTHDDACCPGGANANVDSDCEFICGNGVVEPGEACDSAVPADNVGACPTADDCDDGQDCTVDAFVGAGCAAHCTHTSNTTPADGDGCCPIGGNANNDTDCAAVCGNGTVEPVAGEQCDIDIPSGGGSCPDSAAACSDANTCTSDEITGAGCQAECTHAVVSICGTGDGCCPASCHAVNDQDCFPQCGNSVVEGGEKCDTAISAGTGRCPAPADCGDGNACTADDGIGSGCQAECAHAPITAPVGGDGCCPPSGNAGNDADCNGVCGNGVVEPVAGEHCDISAPAGPQACPASGADCNDNNTCTTDGVTGAGCGQQCQNSATGVCADDDGCCVQGCSAVQDDDCSATCGDGIVELGETCDTAIAVGPGSCPSSASCNDANACTTDGLQSAGTCNAQCVHSDIARCAEGDGCCPAGCSASTDSDCAAVCGNGAVEPGEKCDTAITTGPGSCPSVGSCSDGVACTDETVVGSGCQKQCAYSEITACAAGDGCCPTGCTANEDADCATVCGNGAVEPGETCDTAIASGPGACPTADSCSDSDACSVDSLENGGTCTAECVEAPITACTGGDGCCPAGCNAGNDTECTAVCGNGTVEPGELCDTAVAGSCPTTCAAPDSCTDAVFEDPGTCQARCTLTPIVPCCGNGSVEPGETCDPALAGSCPLTNADCDDGCGCTHDFQHGSASACTAHCSHPRKLCAAPPSGRFAACGRVYDLDDMELVDSTNPGHDVTKMEIRIYDPIDYLMNPSTAAPIGYSAVDACGCWEARDKDPTTNLPGVPTTFSNFVAPAVEDCSAEGAMLTGCTYVSGADDYVPTGSAARALDTETEWGWALHAAPRTLDAAWTAQAQAEGFSGSSLASAGVFAPILLDYGRPGIGPYGGTPGSGVTVHLGGIPTNPLTQWFFEDESPLSRFDVGPSSQDTTGPNGTGILTNAALGDYGGIGGDLEPGCSWRTTLATSLAGVIFAMEIWSACCETDADCAASPRGSICQEEACHPACTTNADCDDNMLCLSHMGGPEACRISAGFLP